MEAIRTIYSSNLVPISSSNIKTTFNILEAEEVAFSLVSDKKHKRKNNASFLPSMSFSDSRSKTSLISQALPFFKAVTTYLALKPVYHK